MAARAVTDANDIPYVGTRPFLAADSNRFFGRSDESRDVANLWRSSQIMILSGRSGVGKTSLLQAGVLPRLDPTNTDWLPIGRVFQGNAFPVAALPEEHNPYTLALLTTWAPGQAQTRLSGLTVGTYLRRRQLRTTPDGAACPVLVAIDQAEDLFAAPSRGDHHRVPFIEELAEVLEELPYVHVLLSVRDDYLDDLANYQDLLGSTADAVFVLSALTAEAAAQAVRSPLAGTGRSFAPGAAEAVVDSLRVGKVAGDIEPSLLQVLCAGLWDELPSDVHEITTAHIERQADTGNVLASFCDQAVMAVASDYGISPGELSSWLTEQFVTELGTRGNAYEGVSRTAGMPHAVARALRDRHILTAARRSGTRWYELQHDRLIDPVRRMHERFSQEGAPAPELSPADYLRTAELAMADGDLGLAARHAEQALRSTAGKNLKLCAEVESLLGNVAHARKQPAEAEARYRAAAALFEILQDASAVAGLLAAIGQTLLAQGRYAEAVEHLHSAVGRIPNDLTFQTELAWALWHAGQRSAAVTVLNGVLTIDGSAADARRARGEILADLGYAEEALRDLDRVQRHQQPSTRAARGLALATLRRLSAADPEIDAALSRAPDSGPVLLYAARVAELGRDPIGAADLARRAVNATDPAVPPHQRRLALQIMEVVN